MRILGIDPGYGITGFGLIEAHRGQAQLLRCGAITTPAGADFSCSAEPETVSVLCAAQPVSSMAPSMSDKMGYLRFIWILLLFDLPLWGRMSPAQSHAGFMCSV